MKSTLCSIFCLIYYRVVIKINLCQCQCTLGKWLIDFFYQYEYVVILRPTSIVVVVIFTFF